MNTAYRWQRLPAAGLLVMLAAGAPRIAVAQEPDSGGQRARKRLRRSGFGYRSRVSGTSGSGDRHVVRIEAFGAVILAAIDPQVAITLGELATMSEREPGERFAPSTTWRFLHRRDHTSKESAHAASNRAGRYSTASASPTMRGRHCAFLDRLHHLQLGEPLRVGGQRVFRQHHEGGEGKPAPDPAGFRLRQAALGELANASRRSVVRALSDLVAQGWVTLGQQRIAIRDAVGLAHFAYD